MTTIEALDGIASMAKARRNALDDLANALRLTGNSELSRKLMGIADDLSWIHAQADSVKRAVAAGAAE